jgi:hypothetical protein
MIYAVIAALHQQQIDTTITYPEICDVLLKEVEINEGYYQGVLPEDEHDSLLSSVRAYVLDKNYNTNPADLILAALCNSLQLSALIYVQREDCVVEIEHRPRLVDDEPRGRIELALRGSGIAAHYDAVVDVSKTRLIHLNAANEFSPETVRPHPKAHSNKKTRKGRKRRSAAILTDTPVKSALEIEQRKSAVKRPVKAIKVKAKNVKRNLNFVSGDCLCLVCSDSWINSRPGEQWSSCIKCNGWAHSECIDVCHNCE